MRRSHVKCSPVATTSLPFCGASHGWKNPRTLITGACSPSASSASTTGQPGCLPPPSPSSSSRSSTCTFGASAAEASDAALITASCAGIIAFARGASTDMQLAAPFCIGMLGWYAWYETDSKFWLFDLYFFVGAATLAKGPVAPFLAMVIIVAFAAATRVGYPAPHHLVAWSCPLSRHGAAVVYRRATPQPQFSEDFFLDTISSASPPAVSSTNTSSGSISPLSFWRLPPGPSSLSPPSSTLCVNPSPNGRPVAPNTTLHGQFPPRRCFS